MTRMNPTNRRFPVALALVLAVGCAAIQNPGAPDQSFDEDKDIQALEEQFGQASAIKQVLAGPQTVATRNQFIAGRLTLINLQYIKFIRKFSASKAQLESAFDLLVTGVGLATTVTGGETVKAALGAVSAGLGATRTSIDKNFFYEKTVPVLITAMNAQRKTALIPILQGVKSDIDQYPLPMALTDLSEYYLAGTFTGALQAIEKDAGVKEAVAEQRIEIVRSPAAQHEIARVDVRQTTASLQKKIDALSDPAALALAKDPPVQDPVLDQVLLAQFPTKLWLTDPKAAKAVLKRRVTLMRDPAVDLPKWEKALP